MEVWPELELSSSGKKFNNHCGYDCGSDFFPEEWSPQRDVATLHPKSRLHRRQVDGSGTRITATQNNYDYGKKFNFYSEEWSPERDNATASKEGPPNEAHDGEDYD